MRRLVGLLLQRGNNALSLVSSSPSCCMFTAVDRRLAGNKLILPSASCHTISRRWKATANDGDVIYESTLNHIVTRVKIFSFGTSASAMIIQPLIWSRHWATLADPLTQMAVGISSAFSGFFMLTPLLLHVMLKRHLIKMYYQPETKTFTALTYTLFMGHQRTRFRAEDIEDMSNPEKQKSALDFGTIKVNKEKVLLFDLSADSFIGKQAYQIIANQCPEGIAMQKLAEAKQRRRPSPVGPPKSKRTPSPSKGEEGTGSGDRIKI